MWFAAVLIPVHHQVTDVRPAHSFPSTAGYTRSVCIRARSGVPDAPGVAGMSPAQCKFPSCDGVRGEDSSTEPPSA